MKWNKLIDKAPKDQQKILFYSDDIYIGIWWDDNDDVNGTRAGVMMMIY